MAFLLCVEFGGYGGMRILLYCVAHPLTGRY
ncbi:aminotransferase, partial [Vibrio parahaemolyticus]|nr:aminotransferase [Vibrio parahaemolyticus]MDF5317042.1 aminotransferase [Vibrio parahaemolyticus]MDF5341490.1 aminotransferase [Vibrio parahaemolyticus]MDF5351428.1 aminotransferase [Vibrio parahaemolyticus]MDF5474164.1 aminotransferase [Vibrio parahaemolyticus]